MNIIYNSFILNNGIRVIFIPRNDNPITSISVFCRVGSRNENSELEGDDLTPLQGATTSLRSSK